MVLEKLGIVLDEDMEQTLAHIGELERVRNGEVFCEYCGIPITLDNIQIISPVAEGGFRYVCSSAECVNRYASDERRD